MKSDRDNGRGVGRLHDPAFSPVPTTAPAPLPSRPGPRGVLWCPAELGWLHKGHWALSLEPGNAGCTLVCKEDARSAARPSQGPRLGSGVCGMEEPRDTAQGLQTAGLRYGMQTLPGRTPICPAAAPGRGCLSSPALPVAGHHHPVGAQLPARPRDSQQGLWVWHRLASAQPSWKVQWGRLRAPLVLGSQLPALCLVALGLPSDNQAPPSGFSASHLRCQAVSQGPQSMRLCASSGWGADVQGRWAGQKPTQGVAHEHFHSCWSVGQAAQPIISVAKGGILRVGADLVLGDEGPWSCHLSLGKGGSVQQGPFLGHLPVLQGLWAQVRFSAVPRQAEPSPVPWQPPPPPGPVRLLLPRPEWEGAGLGRPLSGACIKEQSRGLLLRVCQGQTTLWVCREWPSPGDAIWGALLSAARSGGDVCGDGIPAGLLPGRHVAPPAFLRASKGDKGWSKPASCSTTP